MSRRVYICADYSENNGDRAVVEELNRWGKDNKHSVNFVDMAEVASGSVSADPDCRACDLKAEFNSQINASSAVIFVVGDKTRNRMAGSNCPRIDHSWYDSYCTPYKENANGSLHCKYVDTSPAEKDVGYINKYSYLRHEFEQAYKKGKHIIVVYNSLRKEYAWLPQYLHDFENEAQPFWIINENGQRVGNYDFIKRELEYE